MKKERNRLEGNHEMTKASVAKARETLEELQRSIQALRQAQEQSEAKWSLWHGETQELEKRC